MILFTTWFGTFLIEDETVSQSKTFPKDAKEIAKRLNAVSSSEILEEERTLAEGLAQFFVLDERLTKIGGELIEEEMPHIASEDFGFSTDILHDAMLSLAREKTAEGVGEDEKIAQAICALDDLIQSANLLSERLHEWYGMYFPNQSRVMKDEESISFVLQQKIKDPSCSEEDLRPIIELAKTLQDIQKRKIELEEYIKNQMEKSAANLSTLIGPIIGARLIAKAGGMKRLAKLPSGTIQVLGAEKALFRHLKDGSNPPKHGFIFQHPLVHRAPYWQRGKIARAFASKIAIAARLDEHSDKSMGEELKNDLIERIKEIKERYPEPQKKGRGKR
ncbi:MAG: ribosomal biogenesis protein [Methanomassiliicoccales archaeon]|nr:MAG: ribosomal biogenesis protein [Methanomassiliicoccales archaeon]